MKSIVVHRLLIKSFAVFLFFVSLLTLLPVREECVPLPMEPPRMVNDFTGLFSKDEQASLEHLVRTYQDRTSTQIYVVTVSDFAGKSALGFATDIGNVWGVGQQGKENGIVLLIKPKQEESGGQVAIALGSGVERFISQQEAQGVIDNSLLPLFRKGLFAEGVTQVVYTLDLILGNRFSQSPSDPQSVQGLHSQKLSFGQLMEELYSFVQQHFVAIIVCFVFISFLVLLVLTGRADLAGKILLGLFTLIGALFALALILGGSGSSGSRRGSGSSGSGSGGGGGRFTGGGASGSW